MQEYDESTQENLKDIDVEKNKKVTLGPTLAKGGSKNIYNFENGQVIALPNDQTHTLWERMIKEEVFVSQKFKEIGLKAQNFKITWVVIENKLVPVLEMPSFFTLLNQGIQVRDSKRSYMKKVPVFDASGQFESIVEIEEDAGYGQSMLFANKSNVSSAAHWKSIFKDIIPDCIHYLVSGLDFGSDSFNLCIENTEKTPVHDETKPGLFTKRNQTVRLFFYDFSEKHATLEKLKRFSPNKFLDENNNVLLQDLQSYIDFLFQRTVSTILSGSTATEVKSIVGNLGICCVLDLGEMAKHALESIRQELNNEILYSVVVRLKSAGKGNSLILDLNDSRAFLDKLLKTPAQWERFFGHTLKMAGIKSLNIGNNNLGTLQPDQWTALLNGLRVSGVTLVDTTHNNLLEKQSYQIRSSIKKTPVNYSLPVTVFAEERVQWQATEACDSADNLHQLSGK